MKIRSHKFLHIGRIWFIGIVIISMLSILLTACGSSEVASEISDTSSDATETITVDGQEYTPKENIETVLLMGLDKFEDNLIQTGYVNNQQADFMLLLVLDHDNHTVKALQLNRDTMTEINVIGATGDEATTITAQLCLAHTYGSGGSDSDINTMKAVSKLLYNQSIDHYIAVPMDVVGEVNDRVGGVTVTIPEDMTSINKEWTEGAEIHLMGENALKYVRARGELKNSTNLNRMNRNQDYMDKLWDQIQKKNSEDSDAVDDMILDISTEIDSDYTASKLQLLMKTMISYGKPEVLQTKGTAKQGEVYIEYYVDEDALQKQVAELFYDPVK